ncbi:MAG: aspartate aminotransferase family protein [Planctomycetaceae bacterium]|nr:aspartate aminotransferase family protein [Planctomycetaceae bacterium]
MAEHHYYQIVESLRNSFPQPVSDRVHDAYFAYSFMRVLDQVDDLKSQAPLLGTPGEIDYSSAKQQRISEDSSTVEEVSTKLVDHLNGMFIWGHPRSQINVIPPPSIPSIIGGLLPSIYNANMASEESSQRIVLSEIESIAMTADLLGFDADRVGGLFTFGGTGTLLYGLKLGLEKACPNVGKTGLTEPASILCSERAHYAVKTVAQWMGIGSEQVVEIAASPENEMRTCLLESQLRDLLKQGKKIAGIVATMGTTDHFGLDDLEDVIEIRDRMVDEFALDYVPHVHADAVIGWAWSVFHDYSFEENPLGFPHRTVRALAGTVRRIKHISKADSTGIDFHKIGYTPYISSLFLCKNADDLRLISRGQEETPYLFQSGEYHPGRYSLETSRSAAGPMSALASLQLLGKNGLRSLLGHVVTLAESLRDHLKGHSATTVLNEENFGPVTLFRVYPDGVDTFEVHDRELKEAAFKDKLLEYNQYNRRIFEQIQSEALTGKGVVISMTDCYRETEYGEPVVALKSYLLSPFADEQYVDEVLKSIWRARGLVK